MKITRYNFRDSSSLCRDDDDISVIPLIMDLFNNCSRSSEGPISNRKHEGEGPRHSDVYNFKLTKFKQDHSKF